jgi:hypothetical protein
MSGKPSQEIGVLYSCAEDCKRKADLAPTENARQDLLTLQQNWTNLAHSYEVAEYLLGLHEVG